jgi:hypothetical protein
MREPVRRSYLLIVTLLFLSASAPVFAINVNLAWDPNSEPNLAGYKVYIGAASRTYGVNVPVGNVTSIALTGLTPGTYYFSVTALDSLGNESAYSNEFSTTLACTSSISSSSQSFTSSAVLGSVSVTASAGCNWTATSNAGFITVTSGSSGSGNGTVSYSVAPNTSVSQRTGTMTIAGQTFTVTQAGVQAASLVVAPQTVSAGGSVTATWANIGNPSATDWIGLYATSGAVDNTYVSWRYANGLASGTVPFTIPAGTAPGSTYELRLFGNGGRLATSNTFTITIQATTLSVAAMVSAGGSVTAMWANIASPSATDWIGLYASQGAADNTYLSWRYTNGQASGNVPFTIPASAVAGSTYELRLFNSVGRLATSNSFTIQVTLSVNPTTVFTGQSVTAMWAGISSPTAGDWIGLYASAGTADNAYLSWRYTNGPSTGNLVFPIPAGAPTGSTYELRLFGSSGRLATSNSFSYFNDTP